MNYAGELAALATAALWAVTSVFFAEAGRLIGSFRVNKIRLILAAIIYAVIVLLTTGRLFSPELNGHQVFWLGLSGIVGLVFGDGCGFKALVMIGPRLTTVLYSASPIMAVIIAWVFLGEHLSLFTLAGIAVTIVGITWVVLERRFSPHINSLAADHPDSGSLLKGVLLGLGAALGQAAGLVMAKHAMIGAGGSVEPLEASFVRMVTALAAIWLLAVLRGQAGKSIRAMANLRAVGLSFGGAVAGPFLGVWMSLVAVSLIAAGVASTLNSMTPVLIIPLVIWYYREKVSLRAVMGAVVAVGGVTLIFLG